MRAAMLPETVWYGVPFGPGNRWPKMCAGESGAVLVVMYSKNTFCQGVCYDGGSHVETSSICAVPLGIVETSGVIYYVGEPGAALV